MIIGLCGFKGTGKTTVAEYLEKQYGFKRVNFKDGLVKEMKERLYYTLKEIAGVALLASPEFQLLCKGKSEEEIIDELFKLKPPVMRALMQNYGTEVRRGDNENYWVKKWVETVKETKGNIVVDDVRFFNELSALTELDGVLVRITRSDITEGGDHQSETEHLRFVEDFTIEGVPGSHESVYKAVDSILQDLSAD